MWLKQMYVSFHQLCANFQNAMERSCWSDSNKCTRVRSQLAAPVSNSPKLKLIYSQALQNIGAHLRRFTDAWNNVIPNAVQWCHTNVLSYKWLLPPCGQRAQPAPSPDRFGSVFYFLHHLWQSNVAVTSCYAVRFKGFGGTTDSELWYAVHVGGIVEIRNVTTTPGWGGGSHETSCISFGRAWRQLVPSRDWIIACSIEGLLRG